MGIVANLYIKISASLTDFEKSMAGLEKTLGRTGAKMQSIGSDLTKGLTLPIVALAGISVKAAMDFESSFAGIRKTVDGTVDAGGNLTRFGRELQMQMRDLAKEIPVSVNELNRIGESAGQLGIKSDQVINFTKTIAAMGVATNLSSEQAADGMARFANITQMPQDKIQNLGSVIVELGNKLAATESEILDFGLRIAGAGEIVGLTESQILGIAGAFSSVGIEAEAGGTAVQKALLSMNSAVASGNAKDFGAALGMSGEGFSKLFTNDPGEAFARFVEGVGAAGKQGEAVLRGVGIDDARQIRSFLSLAGAGDLLRTSLKLAGDEWIRNTALTKEAEQRYRTFESQVTLLKNKAQDLAITFGTSLIQSLQRLWPQFEKVAAGAASAVEWFSRLSPGAQGAAFAVGGVLAALGPLVYVLGSVMKAGAGLAGLFRMSAMNMTLLGTNAVGAAGGLSRLWLAFLPFAAPVAILAGLAAIVVGIAKLMDAWTTPATKRLAIEYVNSPRGPGTNSTSPWVVPGKPVDPETQRLIDSAGLPGNPLSTKFGPKAAPFTVAGMSGADALAEMGGSGVTPNLAAFGGGAEAAKKAREAFDQRIEDLAKVNQPIFDMIAKRDQETVSGQFELNKLETTFDKSFSPIDPDWMQKNLRELETTIIPGFNFGELMAVELAPPPSLFKATMTRSLSVLPQVIMDAVRRGGGIGQAVGGLFGGNIGSSILGSLTSSATSGIGKFLGGGIGGGISAALGGAIGSIIPGLGTALGSMIGPLIGKLGGLFKGLFGGPSQKELEGRDAAKQFRDQVQGLLTDTQKLEAGGKAWEGTLIGIESAYLATGRTAAQALTDMDRLWKAEKLGGDAVKKVIDEINEAFKEQAADTDRLNAAIKTYGFSVEELGPKFRQQQLTDQAKELIEDWRVLVSSGIDVSVVNTHMADTFNQYLATAINAGVEVPGALRPILESLANQGVLLDGNGNKITDLNTSGVMFSETMTQGFDRVVIKLQQLIDTLQGTGMAINDLPTSYALDIQLRNLDQVNAQIQQLQGSMSGWDRITSRDGGGNQELNDLIAQRDALTQQIAGSQVTAASDATGAATGLTVNVNAGTIIGNPDELAVAVAGAVEGGGEPFSRWRTLTQQLAT